MPVNIVSFVASRIHGKRNAVYNGHRYTFERTGKNNRSYWRCTLTYSNICCRARLVLDKNNGVFNATVHNHCVKHVVYKVKENLKRI